jgi:hypothetical protein
MSALLGHLDFAPLFYGVLMFLGIWSMYSKLINGHWLRLFIEISVFSLVFVLHGGTMTGGFSAMISALLAGLFLGRKKA